MRLHSGNGPHQEMDRRAIASFDQALVDVGLASDDRRRQVLHDYFAWTTLTTISRYHRSADAVPDGLHIPRWSWDGLVEGGDGPPISRYSPVSRSQLRQPAGSPTPCRMSASAGGSARGTTSEPRVARAGLEEGRHSLRSDV